MPVMVLFEVIQSQGMYERGLMLGEFYACIIQILHGTRQTIIDAQIL